MPSFYVKTAPDDEAQGPFELADLRAFASDGSLKPDHQVSQDQSEWTKALSVEGLTFPEQGSGNGADACPNCSARLSANAVICIECGLDLRSGKLISEQAGSEAPEDSDEEARTYAKRDIEYILGELPALADKEEGKILFSGWSQFNRFAQWAQLDFSMPSDETPLGAYVYCRKSAIGRQSFSDGVFFTDRAIYKTKGLSGISTIPYSSIANPDAAPPANDGKGTSIAMRFFKSDESKERFRRMLAAQAPEKMKAWEKERDEGLERHRALKIATGLSTAILAVSAIIFKACEPHTPWFEICLAVVLIGFIPAWLLAMTIVYFAYTALGKEALLRSAFMKPKKKEPPPPNAAT